MIEAELWVSFAAMLRAYGLVAGLDGGAVPEIHATENSVTLAAGSARLDVHCDLQTGEGNWVLSGAHSSTQGIFALMPDGRIALDGNRLDLDFAAIDLAASLMRDSASAGEDA
ncbi:MAG TPA: hypothetical protein VHX60_14290 [Acidobacteriaceae bacterium]|nr:hypothetical protein [Acidobacteriaceae bacterium]